MNAVIWIVAGVAVILLAGAVAKKTRLGAPLLLVAIGMAVSLLPAVPAIEIEPEWVLAGVLPPLLYSAAVRMPLVDFRREFATISAFSVALVIVTAVLAGLAIHFAVPRFPLHVAIALGAIISPTDAAATAIIAKAGAPRRVLTILEGESLLNDATSLVTLRTAVAASVSFAGMAWDFIWAIGAAVTVGAVVGWLAMRLGAHITDPTLHTLYSFLIPFAAYLPVEKLGSSGLVSVVVAGLITGRGAYRYSSATNRLTQQVNWQTVDVLAEGAIFLAMGLQLFGLHQEFVAEQDSLVTTALTAALGLLVVLVVRGVFTWALLTWRRLSARRQVADAAPARRRTAARPSPQAPLGWREGMVLEWAGLRGVVTLAAAQTLPLDTPERPALVLIAFAVAAVSLIGQGASLPWLIRLLGLGADDPAEDLAWRMRLRQQLAQTAQEFLAGPAEQLKRPGGERFSAPALELAKSTANWVTVPNTDEPRPSTDNPPAALHREELRELRLATVRQMRRSLTSAAKQAAFPAPVLRQALDELDREELALGLDPPAAET
ncbi:MAG: sodium:proton antiporter [Bifidobacteriaceae bacterium]|jgi:CPA1 family monovalent cation:H+ antiporter|nr:sodium:proton antiporter [Bifidobacteriaceae bacterium]